MSVIQNIKMSVSEGFVCEALVGHAFEYNRDGRFSESSIKGSTLQYSAKLSVERGLLVQRVYNWGWITVRYTE